MKTWWNAVCALTLMGLGCGGTVEPQSDTSVDMTELQVSRMCAGPKGAVCPEGTYCSTGPSGRCPGPTQTGICASRPELCPNVFAPVCGCDGRNYPNACFAARAGVSVAAVGECPARQSCGGFAGVVCPGQGVCVDDPSDDCHPDAGGADCGGFCKCVQRIACPLGFHFDASPAVCACLPDVNPCAVILCPPGTTCVARGDTASCEPLTTD